MPLSSRRAGGCSLLPDTLHFSDSFLSWVDRKGFDFPDLGALGDGGDHMQLVAMCLWSAVPKEFGLPPLFLDCSLGSRNWCLRHFHTFIVTVRGDSVGAGPDPLVSCLGALLGVCGQMSRSVYERSSPRQIWLTPMLPSEAPTCYLKANRKACRDSERREVLSPAPFPP